MPNSGALGKLSRSAPWSTWVIKSRALSPPKQMERLLDSRLLWLGSPTPSAAVTAVGCTASSVLYLGLHQKDTWMLPSFHDIPCGEWFTGCSKATLTSYLFPVGFKFWCLRCNAIQMFGILLCVCVAASNQWSWFQCKLFSQFFTIKSGWKEPLVISRVMIRGEISHLQRLTQFN